MSLPQGRSKTLLEGQQSGPKAGVDARASGAQSRLTWPASLLVFAVSVVGVVVFAYVGVVIGFEVGASWAEVNQGSPSTPARAPSLIRL